MKNHLLIFDLDGTLYDTRRVNFEAYRIPLKENGIRLDKDFFMQRCNGSYYKTFLPLVSPALTQEQIEWIHERKKELYRGCLCYATANENLFNMIRCMRGENYISLVTTASRKNAAEILDYFGHTQLFDLVLAQEDIQNKKPDPEGFLKAMDFLGIRPEHTMVFEDSGFGIQAALQSGAGVCRVLDFIVDADSYDKGINFKDDMVIF